MRARTERQSRPKSVPLWLILGMIAVLAALSIVLAYAAYKDIYQGENRGFPLKTESSPIPAATYQAGSELLSAELRSPAGDHRADTLVVLKGVPAHSTGADAALTRETSSPPAGAEHLFDCAAGGTAPEAGTTVNKILVTSIDGGSTWL